MAGHNPQKKILVIHYSQSGQLTRVLESITAPLAAAPNLSIDHLVITPEQDYPFPWPLLRFINAFPESVYDKGCALQTPGGIDPATDYDLVILGYQVWYLSPSIPTTAFLQSDYAHRLLNNKKVVTVVACRNMWLKAQEKVKHHLARIGAGLIGNIALVDEAGSALSFFATPLWVLTGKKGPFPLGIPKAGVSDGEISAASRFGQRILEGLNGQRPMDDTLLRGTGAVTVNVNMIASENIALRSFRIWGKLFLALGRPDALSRQLLAIIYSVFLVTMILTVVPLNVLVKKLLTPITRERNAQLREYYAMPSGEELHR